MLVLSVCLNVRRSRLRRISSYIDRNRVGEILPIYMLCIFTMGSLAILEKGSLPVVAEETEEKWWLHSSAPASHMYLQYWDKPYSGYQLMTSKEWRRITKTLPRLWKDAYLQCGKNITVTEVVRAEDDYTVYTVVIEDGDRYVRYRNLPGYSAKSVIFDEILGIENYQFYTTLVCQQTPIWDTVIRICRSKGAKVTRTTDGWTFES